VSWKGREIIPLGRKALSCSVGVCYTWFMKTALISVEIDRMSASLYYVTRSWFTLTRWFQFVALNTFLGASYLPIIIIITIYLNLFSLIDIDYWFRCSFFKNSSCLADISRRSEYFVETLQRYSFTLQ
jgi:hypothetical protein